MTNQELYQEENRQLLKTIAIGIDDFKKVLQGQIDITVNQPDKMTVNTEKSVEVTNLEQMKEWVDNLGTVVTKAIEDNSYKPVSEVSIKNAKDIIPDKLTISNLSDIKTYFSDVTRAIKNNQPIVNITKQEVVFPKSPKDAIPVRLSDGKSFYNAIATAISSASNGQAHLHVGGSPVTTANPVPVDIQDASVTINGDVTVSSEVEVKNDSGNPVPVSADSLPLPTGASTEAKQDTIIGHVDGIEGAVDQIEGYVDGIETLLTTIDGDTGNISTKIDTVASAVSGSEMQVDVVGALPAGTNAIGKLAANSGVDIGDVDVTSSVATSFATGSNLDIDTTAEQLVSASVACKFGVTVKAATTNTGTVYIGASSSVTAGTNDSTDGFPLEPGESVTIPVNNINLLYGIASVVNQKVFLMAV